MRNPTLTAKSPRLLRWFKLLGVAMVYAVVSKASLIYFSGHGAISIFWPPAGLALAVVLLGGTRYALSVFVGAVLANGTDPHLSLTTTAGIASANALESLVGRWLILRWGGFSDRLTHLRDYFRLMLLGGFSGSAVGGAAGAGVLWATGVANSASFAGNVLHWWMGDVLGIVVLTPLLLVWRHFPSVTRLSGHRAEVVLAFLLAFVGGQIFYFAWFSSTTGAVVGNYWMFLIVAWIAVRFGVHGVVLVLLMATVQGVLGSYQGVGMFAGDSVQTQQINFWFFLLLLSTVGVALASHFAEHDQLTEELRSAKNRQGALLDAIPDLLFEIGLDGRYHQIYTYHPELLAASPEVLLGSRVQDRLPAEAAAVVLAALQQAKREGISAGHQYSLALPRGNVWFELSVSCMVTNNDATDPHFIVLSRDITARKLAEQDLRIAAIAFESQEGMLVASADHVILRVNQAFTQITGYSAHEIVGVAESFVHSEEQDADFHVKVFDTVHSTGRWQGESWIQHKNGELVAVWGTLTEVCDERQRVTHYVRTLTDITHLKQQQQHRLKQEAQLRDALVREVHHRIKNNLQGVTGVLRQYSHKHPETIEPMNQAIAQVQSIAAIHGLRGRNVSGEVLLHELLSAVAAGVQSIWHIRIDVDVKADCGECMVLQTEAVPLALVLNELLSNSVKHGGPQADVHVTLEQIATRPDEAANVRISIVNALGDEPVTTVSASDATSRSSSGLELVAALLPRQFAQLHQSALGQQFVTTLELTSPAITWKAHG